MRNGSYRHSVWVDVLGVLLFGAVLLGGAGYVLYHVRGATSNSVVQGSGGGARLVGPGSRPTRRSGGGARGGLPGGGFAPGQGGEGPLLGDRNGGASSGAKAPFSSSWREGATPELVGPSGSAGEGTPGLGGSASGPSGASRSLGASGSPGGSQSPASSLDYRQETARSAQSGEAAGARWRGEAQKLAGRARALSGQLGQLEREASRSEGGKKTSSEKTSGEASTASASKSNDRDVPPPPSVPIDDHLHWLVVVGLLWGIWRLS
jgi:hypothetical protein